MYYIDTHCHLDSEKFEKDVDEVVLACDNYDVKKIVVANVDEHQFDNLYALCEKYPQKLFPTIGIHPVDINKEYKKQLEFVESKLPNERIVAIGEVGIDAYWSKELLDEQIEAFRMHLDLAVKYNLPVIIHCRNAYDILLKILAEKKREADFEAVIHCFGGGIQEAKKAIELGLYLGIGGVVTFKNSNLAEIVAEVGIDRLVLETDAPYLAPTPYRGKRNTPEYIPIIAQKIAEVCKTTPQKVAEVTTANAEKLFRI